MGTSKSIGELAGKFESYAYVFGKANRNGVQASAQVYKERLLANAARDSGGDMRLSRWRRRFGASGDGTSPKLGAGYQLFGYDNAKAVLRPRPYGIWALLEGGAVPHRIAPFKYARGRRRGEGNSALRFPNGTFAAYVNHPGSRGKETFSGAVPPATPGAKRVFAEAHRRGLLEVFR